MYRIVTSMLQESKMTVSSKESTKFYLLKWYLVSFTGPNRIGGGWSEHHNFYSSEN